MWRNVENVRRNRQEAKLAAKKGREEKDTGTGK